MNFCSGVSTFVASGVLIMNMSKLSKEYLNKCRVALSEEQAQSLSNSNNWEHVERDKVHKDWDTLYKELATYIDIAKCNSNKVQEIIEKHYQIACRFYTPSKEAYIGMGIFYQENQDMKVFHNTYHPQMVNFLADSISEFAIKKL